MGKDLEYRVEFKDLPDEILEIRYFQPPKDSSCLSWKMPKGVADETIAWWGKKRMDKQVSFPVKDKTKTCEFTRNNENSINIKEFDSFGRYKTIGWSLPKGVLDRLLEGYLGE